MSNLIQLQHNLFLADFSCIESEILRLLKKELEKYGVIAYDEIPRKDYIQLLRYFTLSCVCDYYRTLENRKNTILFVNSENTNKDILKFLLELERFVPILLYITSDLYTNIQKARDPSLKTDISSLAMELRYSKDFGQYSLKKFKQWAFQKSLIYFLENEDFSILFS